MCGIFGVVNKSKFSQKEIELFQMALMKMHHRGPDYQSVTSVKDNVLFGHLRLSIIDLNEASNQPFQIDDKYWLVYNGEIYNYIEIRDELIKLGHTFRTQGDTEVLLKSYIEWGENCVNRFNGMWAFSIYDLEKEKLFCSRDRFGIKPFNYAFVDGMFIFSSEIKSIIAFYPKLKIPNYNVIANYCRTSVGAQINETWFEDIYRLEPAHNLTIENNKIKKYRYWDYPKKINTKISFDESILTYKYLFEDSVRIRMRSDVPIGFTLSSGIDSTSLVCILENKFNGNKNTYTAAFPKYNFERSEKRNFKNDIVVDEPYLVKKLTNELDLKSNIIEIDYTNYVNELRSIIFHLESGHGSPAVFPLYHILKVAKNDVTVVLEGQGADELLAGYISNVSSVYFIELIKEGNFKKAYIEAKAFLKVYSFKAALMLWVRKSNFDLIKRLYFLITNKEKLFVGKLKSYRQIKDYPINPIGFDNKLNEHLFKDHTGGLVSLLHYGDAISMAHSLESRLPYMDYRLVEFGFTLPSSYKIRNGMGKYIHRKSMEGIVPDYIINNPIKFGFESPLAHLFSKDDENSAKSILLSDRSVKRGLFSERTLRKVFDEQKTGKKDQSRLLYRILSVELWFREFIDQ